MNYLIYSSLILRSYKFHANPTSLLQMSYISSVIIQCKSKYSHVQSEQKVSKSNEKKFLKPSKNSKKKAFTAHVLMNRT